jgi:mannose-6-phosphate isomerase-like protein (cupin superfamily)
MTRGQKNKHMQRMIETYEHNGIGYNPFFIRDGWQVAQLNHMDAQDLDGIGKMDMHRQTDEVFILLRGTAVLIAASGPDAPLHFECVKMQPGITYNIPVNTWHNIAMDRDASVIIVERSGTHLGDFVYRQLTPAQQDVLKEKMRTALHASDEGPVK